MTLEQAEQVVEMLNDAEHESGVMLYSGRGMYGSTCVAIVTDSLSALVLVGHLLGQVGVDEYDLPSRIDSLGLSWVVY